MSENRYQLTLRAVKKLQASTQDMRAALLMSEDSDLSRNSDVLVIAMEDAVVNVLKTRQASIKWEQLMLAAIEFQKRMFELAEQDLIDTMTERGIPLEEKEVIH